MLVFYLCYRSYMNYFDSVEDGYIIGLQISDGS